jgi:hypothetical protein
MVIGVKIKRCTWDDVFGCFVSSQWKEKQPEHFQMSALAHPIMSKFSYFLPFKWDKMN